MKKTVIPIAVIVVLLTVIGAYAWGAYVGNYDFTMDVREPIEWNVLSELPVIMDPGDVITIELEVDNTANNPYLMTYPVYAQENVRKCIISVEDVILLEEEISQGNETPSSLKRVQAGAGGTYYFWQGTAQQVINPNGKHLVKIQLWIRSDASPSSYDGTVYIYRGGDFIAKV